MFNHTTTQSRTIRFGFIPFEHSNLFRILKFGFRGEKTVERKPDEDAIERVFIVRVFASRPS